MLKAIESIMSGKNLKYKHLEWVVHHARELGLKGITYFKNDGSIRVIAEGEERELNIFINKLKRGPFLFPVFSPIENFSVTEETPKNEFEDFSISESIE